MRKTRRSTPARRLPARDPEQLKLLAELEGRIAAQPQVNIMVSAEWVEVRTQILVALDPYPEARQAVANALHKVTTSHTHSTPFCGLRRSWPITRTPWQARALKKQITEGHLKLLRQSGNVYTSAGLGSA